MSSKVDQGMLESDWLRILNQNPQLYCTNGRRNRCLNLPSRSLEQWWYWIIQIELVSVEFYIFERQQVHHQRWNLLYHWFSIVDRIADYGVDITYLGNPGSSIDKILKSRNLIEVPHLVLLLVLQFSQMRCPLLQIVEHQQLHKTTYKWQY